MSCSGLPPSACSVALRCFSALATATLLLEAGGCAGLHASQAGDWTPDHAVLAYAEFGGNRVTVHNIRNCAYRTADDYTPQYYDKMYDLDRLTSVDFIMVPFTQFSGGAHTFLSFGFENRDYLAVSAEMRKRRRDLFPSLRAGLPLRPLVYVIGDEHDLIGMRTNYRKNDVYVYRLRTTAEQARVMFVDVMRRTNKLINEPEYYNVVTNNCVTNVLRHVNAVAVRPIPHTWQVLLPGYCDRLVYEMGLFATESSFDETKRRAHVNDLAIRYASSPDFSALIRR